MKIILNFVLLTLSFSSFSQTARQIENEKAFAKVYGYVKYFYPGDEANKIDWDKFAIYGAKIVEGCKTDTELQDSLNGLINNLMPGVKIIDAAEKVTFDNDLLKPKELKDYKIITWQHLGVGLIKDKRSPYQSARTNRPTIFNTKFSGRASAGAILKAESYAGKKFELTARARMLNGDGKGYLWFRVDLENNEMGLLDNMSNRPITSREWNTYKISGKIDEHAKRIVLGPLFEGEGTFEVDNFSLKIEDKEVLSVDFEKEMIDKEPTSFSSSTITTSVPNAKYGFNIKQDGSNKYLMITSPALELKSEIFNQELFTKHASFGDYIEKSITENLKIFLPIALYGTKDYTYPKIAQTNVEAKYAIDRNVLTSENLHFRLGNLINMWNVFQHFYPYFDVVETNWENDLGEAIARTYKDATDLDFAKTIKQLTAKLKDGHITVSYPIDVNYYLPPVAWKWVEGKLVITAELDEKYDLKQGDVVVKINGEDATQYFKTIKQYISAATPGYLNYRAEREALLGPKNSSFNLTMESGREVKLIRTQTTLAYYSLLPKQSAIKSLGNQLTYIHIGVAKMKMINDSLSLLKNSKAIICDLRGYPTDNVQLIEYLMVKNDNSKSWLQNPETIYPDQEKKVGFKTEGWALKPKAPHLNAKIFFLIDAQAISYAESYLSFIEHYKLATIIGEPTAGTNGDVNTITLPGGYSIRFTGMKVLKHDGTQHHGIGIMPNIYVSQTIAGISEKRDEILERAIAEAKR